MRPAPFLNTHRAVEYGFILAHETLWLGVIPAEWDGENQLIFYNTRAEAEAERVDASEMRADSIEDARMEPEDGDDGPWVESAVLHPDGALSLLDVGLTFTADALRSLHHRGHARD